MLTSPSRVLLPSVVQANRMILSLVQKQRKVLLSDLKNGEVWALALWTLKNWCFWTVVLERLLKVPWIARRSNQSILKEINPEYSLEGLTLKLKLQYFGHLMRRSDSLEKTLMLGKIEGRRGRRTAEEQVRWHHWLDGNEFEQAPELVMDREAWPAITRGVAKSWTELSNWTDWARRRTRSCWSGAGMLLMLLVECSAPSSVSALRLPPPSWISVRCAALLHRACGAQVSGTAFLHLELRSKNVGYKTSARGSQWASETSTKETDKKKVRLYYPASIFISRELLMGFTSGKSLLCLLYSLQRGMEGCRSSLCNCCLLVLGRWCNPGWRSELPGYLELCLLPDLGPNWIPERRQFI